MDSAGGELLVGAYSNSVRRSADVWKHSTVREGKFSTSSSGRRMESMGTGQDTKFFDKRNEERLAKKV